jgi:hypothetical protein
MAATPEGKVKAEIKKLLDSMGFWRAGSKKPAVPVVGTYYMPVNNGMGVHGIPDFVGSWKGSPANTYGVRFDIEAKKPGGEPTANQLNRHQEIREGGGIVLLVDNVDELRDWFQNFPLPAN